MNMSEGKKDARLHQDFPQKIFIVLALTYVFLVLSIVISTYWVNYGHSDGIVLPNHEVVGGDFLCFYVAGENARNNVEGLYDFDRSHMRQQQIIAGRNVQFGYLPFVYPPLVALIFSPLSAFSFQRACLAWLTFSVFLSSLAFVLVLRWTRISKPAKIVFFIGCFAFVPYIINCLAGGQTSCIGLFVFAMVYFFLKSNRDFLAGMALSLSYYKPPLFLVFLIFVFLHRRWKMLVAFFLMAVILITASILMIGVSGFLGYLQKVSQYTYGHEIMRGITLPPTLGVGLYALITATMSGTPMASKLLFWLLVGLLVLATYLLCIRGRREQRETEFFDLLFALEVTMSTLLSLQLLYYDLTVLLVPMVIVGGWLWTSAMDRTRVFSFIAVIGLYTEFIYRESLARKTPVKAATVILCIWIVALLVSVSRRTATDTDLIYSQ